MINAQYKLTIPYNFENFCENMCFEKGKILVRPLMLSICKADIRYYFGIRDAKVMKKKLPMALIHEACGTILADPDGKFKQGDKVILLPNIAGQDKSIEENYRLDSKFRSSTADGFMQEMVNLPDTQIVKYGNISDESASMAEFISVGVHAVFSYKKHIVEKPLHIGVWGDGALGYVICCVVKHYFPNTRVTCIGTHRNKLAMFQFIDECLTVDEVKDYSAFDAAIECVGGCESATAIEQMIAAVRPEAMLILLGVSEEAIPINTRMVLEKGLTLLGRSRSGREDFIETVHIMETDHVFAKRIRMLISEVVSINNINDIHTAFQATKVVDYKVVMDWKI